MVGTLIGRRGVIRIEGRYDVPTILLMDHSMMHVEVERAGFAWLRCLPLVGEGFQIASSGNDGETWLSLLARARRRRRCDHSRRVHASRRRRVGLGALVGGVWLLSLAGYAVKAALLPFTRLPVPLRAVLMLEIRIDRGRVIRFAVRTSVLGSARATATQP